jgi:formylmethanofuran dehydrogenase subunit E
MNARLSGEFRMRRSLVGILFILVLTACFQSARAQTPQQWVEWGDRVHGGFGSLIAYGIRIGLDSMQRLGAQRRELIVEYTDGPQSPCPCVLDGIAIAVSASLGQRTLTLDQGRTPAGLLGEVTITNRKTGRKVTYRLPQSALPLMQAINRDEKGVGRFEAVMKIDASALYSVQ